MHLSFLLTFLLALLLTKDFPCLMFYCFLFPCPRRNDTGIVHISRVDKSAFDWTVLVQVIEADHVKIARDKDLSTSFRRFQFGDFQV